MRDFLLVIRFKLLCLMTRLGLYKPKKAKDNGLEYIVTRRVRRRGYPDKFVDVYYRDARARASDE